jgi:hypothetical protein
MPSALHKDKPRLKLRGFLFALAERHISALDRPNVANLGLATWWTVVDLLELSGRLRPSRASGILEPALREGRESHAAGLPDSDRFHSAALPVAWPSTESWRGK